MEAAAEAAAEAATRSVAGALRLLGRDFGRAEQQVQAGPVAGAAALGEAASGRRSPQLESTARVRSPDRWSPQLESAARVRSPDRWSPQFESAVRVRSPDRPSPQLEVVLPTSPPLPRSPADPAADAAAAAGGMHEAISALLQASALEQEHDARRASYDAAHEEERFTMLLG